MLLSFNVNVTPRDVSSSLTYPTTRGPHTSQRCTFGDGLFSSRWMPFPPTHSVHTATHSTSEIAEQTVKAWRSSRRRIAPDRSPYAARIATGSGWGADLALSDAARALSASIAGSCTGAGSMSTGFGGSASGGAGCC